MKNNKNIEKPLLGDDNEELRTVTLLKVLPVILCLLFVLFGVFACNKSSSESDTKITAYVCMQDIVTPKLKNPSSAKYPSYDSNYVTSLGNNKYKIRAYVDSTNSFNAQIRTWFTCTLTLTKQGYKNGSVVFDK